MSFTPIDSVCTDAYLESRVGGAENLQRLLPKDWTSAREARQSMFDSVLRRLKLQTPPIVESDLADVTELRDVVAYGTLAELYANASTGPDDVFHAQSRRYERMYQAELQGLKPTVTLFQVAAPMSVPFDRR
jgi:hypothetical protein